MATTRSDAGVDDAVKTQSFFREINNRVAELAQRGDAAPPRFICECPSVDCGATVALALEVYETVRADPGRFIVLGGHEQAASDDVLERQGDCLIVRKRGIDADTGPADERSSSPGSVRRR